MRETDFNASLRSFQELLRELSLDEHIRLLHSLDASAEFRAMAREAVPYEELYALGLQKRDYNVLLTDFSYLQFTYVEENRTFGVRYAYYPNPHSVISFAEFKRDVLVASEDEFGDYVQFLSEQPPSRLVPVVRYDVDFGGYRECMHPTAHFHFGAQSEGRWATRHVLSPKAFGLHVLKLHYLEEWEYLGARDDGTNRFDDEIIVEKAGCAAIEQKFFSLREGKLIHVA